MNWFNRWLSKKVQRYWNEAREEKIYGKPDASMHVGMAISKNSTRGLDTHATLNFRLHHAENGWIVEVTNYDQRTDRHTTKMHLIGDHEEFDKSICQIITLETLRGH
jgi:hypothetical protein